MKKEYLIGMAITVVISLIAGGVGYYIGSLETQYNVLTEYNELTLENYEYYVNFTENPAYIRNRFYTEGLADFLQIQLLMYPFNKNDIVNLEFGGLHNELIYINHTEPNPDYSFNRDIYNYIMHFDYELTFEEN